MQYKIIEAANVRELEMEVQKRINSGWSLHGDLRTYITENDENRFVHSMTLDIGKNK